MTEPTDPRPDAPTPGDLPDEVASAFLDGEATAEEVARIEAVQPGDDLARRLDELTRVTERVRVAPPAPAGLVDLHLDAALAEFDRTAAGSGDGDTTATDGATTGGSGGGSVTDLAAAAAARRPIWQRVPLGAVAAAVAVVALVGAIGISSVQDGDDDDMATSAMDDGSATRDSIELSEEAAPGAEGDVFDAEITADGDMGDDSGEDMADEAMGTAGSTAGAGGSGMVGRPSFDSAEELVAHFRAQPVDDDEADDGAGEAADTDTDSGTDDSSANPDVDPCDAVDVAGVDPDQVGSVVPVLLEGDPATVVITAGDRLFVVDDLSCAVVLEDEV